MDLYFSEKYDFTAILLFYFIKCGEDAFRWNLLLKSNPYILYVYAERNNDIFSSVFFCHAIFNNVTGLIFLLQFLGIH